MNSYRQILNECRDYLLLNLEDEHEPHFNLKDIDDELRINEDRIREYGSWKAKFTRIIERFNDKNTHVWDDTGYWKIEDMMKSSRNLVRLTAMHADYL
ncbi:MAG: hypothetical protein LBI53_05255 [Candidatus Peribacteria bacterium]|jgi:hypothetical protein|nr:hypothetical protein [Candidatus Peribacteria bacterium]